MQFDALVTVGTIAAFVGFLSNQLIDLLKPRIKELVPDQQRSAVARLLALAVTAVLALTAGFTAEALGYIEPGGAWLVFGAVFPATGAWFQVDARRQAAKQAVQE